MEVLFVLVAIAIWFFLTPVILKWLWNTTLPDLFDFKIIGYWQCFRLILIVAILFGGGDLVSFHHSPR